MKKINIIYIMGPGRSGSTILGITLGNLPKSQYVGELYAWPLLKGQPKTIKKNNIKFWNEIKQNISHPNQYFINNYFKKFEYHNSIFYNRKPYEKINYIKYAEKLFNTIKNVSGKDIIIDSSHYPLRAYWLNKSKNINIKLIYITKNPIEIINSFQKKNIEQTQKSPLAANLYLFIVSFLSSIIYNFFHKDNKIKIKYEDFVCDPKKITKVIADFIGIENYMIDFRKLNTGNIFEGNRIRENELISIEKSTVSWKLNKLWIYISFLIQLPFITINNYLKIK